MKDDKKQCQEVIKKIEYFFKVNTSYLTYEQYCLFWEEVLKN